MTARSLTARCPAKVNLALRVLGAREDGYHELDTIFQAIDLWDELEAEPAEGLTLVCDDPALPTDGTNLVLRAARLLQRRAGGHPGGARLSLRKRIPVQAGLGGGSSDAAGSLLICRRLWDLPLGDGELLRLAAELGADVPFFLVGGTARGRGRGDVVEALPFVGERPVLLGIPPFGVSTAEVFAEVRERLTLPRNGVSLHVFSALKWPEGNDFHFAVNDLEAVVFRAWPELESFRDAVWRDGARTALLSGSGSVVYGVFDDRGQCERAANNLRNAFAGWHIMTTKSVIDSAHVVPVNHQPPD
jgi:4-diphosphocytidyl-2-C-methyl-D-erythritol kinase